MSECEFVVNWTQEHYPTVRSKLSESRRAVFDRMAYEGLRLREAAAGSNISPLLISWRRACEQAGVPHAPVHTLRTDHIAGRYINRKDGPRDE